MLDLTARLAPSAASSDEIRKRSRNGVITRGMIKRGNWCPPVAAIGQIIWVFALAARFCPDAGALAAVQGRPGTELGPHSGLGSCEGI